MKTIQRILTLCCLGLFVASFAACTGDASEVKTVDEADRNLPPAATGEMDADDPDSGVNTGFE